MNSSRIPNLFVALVVSLILFFGFEASWGWIVFSGLLMDVGSNWFLGIGTLALVLISWLVNKLKVVAELRSKRYLFALLLSALIAFSSIIFDLLMHAFTILEKQIGIPGVIIFIFQINSDYAVKIFFSIIFGILMYLAARKMKLGRIQTILSKR